MSSRDSEKAAQDLELTHLESVSFLLSSDFDFVSFCFLIFPENTLNMSCGGIRGTQGAHRSSIVQRSYSSGYGPALHGESRNYARSMMSRFSSTFDRKRRQDVTDPSRPSTPTQRYGDASGPSARPLVVELTEFYPRDNAKEHHTDMYELVTDALTPTPVLRRGQNFFFAIRFDRSFEQQRDFVRVCFSFGKFSIEFLVLTNCTCVVFLSF